MQPRLRSWPLRCSFHRSPCVRQSRGPSVLSPTCCNIFWTPKDPRPRFGLLQVQNGAGDAGEAAEEAAGADAFAERMRFAAQAKAQAHGDQPRTQVRPMLEQPSLRAVLPLLRAVLPSLSSQPLATPAAGLRKPPGSPSGRWTAAMLGLMSWPCRAARVQGQAPDQIALSPV